MECLLLHKTVLSAYQFKRRRQGTCHSSTLMLRLQVVLTTSRKSQRHSSPKFTTCKTLH